MALNREQKQVIVAEVAEVAASALSVVAAYYRGLTVAEMSALRAKARDQGVYLRVVRNTLARCALKDTDFACLSEALTGPLVLAFSREEPNAAARLIKEFMKEHEKLEVGAIVINRQLLSAKDLSAVADLPSRSEALALLMSVMKAPVDKFVRTLAEPHTRLVRTVAAYRDQKQAA